MLLVAAGVGWSFRKEIMTFFFPVDVHKVRQEASVAESRALTDGAMANKARETLQGAIAESVAASDTSAFPSEESVVNAQGNVVAAPAPALRVEVHSPVVGAGGELRA